MPAFQAVPVADSALPPVSYPGHSVPGIHCLNFTQKFQVLLFFCPKGRVVKVNFCVLQFCICQWFRKYTSETKHRMSY